jgi:hypothetical protein
MDFKRGGTFERQHGLAIEVRETKRKIAVPQASNAPREVTEVGI